MGRGLQENRIVYAKRNAIKTTRLYSIFTFQTIEAVIYLILFRVRASRHEMSPYSKKFKKNHIKHQFPHGLSVTLIDLIISAKFQD